MILLKEMEHIPWDKKESRFDALLKERKGQGWHYMGREGLARTVFQKDAKFVEVPFQTEEDVRNKYLQMAREQDTSGNYEVDLVLDTNTDKLNRLKEVASGEEFQNIIKNLREEDKAYLVFLRKKSG